MWTTRGAPAVRRLLPGRTVPAMTSPSLPSELHATVLGHVDGDTFRAAAALLEPIGFVGRVRLREIDTEEISGKRATERGRAAAARTAELLPVGMPVMLVGIASRLDTYGRLVCSVTLPDGSDLESTLIRENLADPISDAKRNRLLPDDAAGST